MELLIDPEFQSALTALSSRERSQLEANILADGCRVPIVVWSATTPPTIVDGHNRYDICTHHGIAFRVEEKQFGDRDEAIAWIANEHLGRRNISPEQISYLRGKAYNREKTAGHGSKSAYQGDTQIVRERLAAQHGVSEATISRDGVFAESLNVLVELAGGDTAVRDAALKRHPRSEEAGKSAKPQLDKAAVRKLAKMAEKDEEQALTRLRLIVDEGKTLKEAEKEVGQIELIEASRQVLAEKGGNDEYETSIECCLMEDFLPRQKDLDAIITDPPYPREYLHLFGTLAQLAKAALKPDGILAVMCGQSYLPEIIAAMSAHMEYRWMLAYLTPGGQAVQLWDRKVNTFWKPVIVLGGAPYWLGDVVKSEVNDNDKRFHFWGQSESGMTSLLKALTKPGDLVCDPFAGAGSTGLACLALGRKFTGCDQDETHVQTARARMRLFVQDAPEHDEDCSE